MQKSVVFLLSLVSLLANAQMPVFESSVQTAAPDYSLGKNWAALPFRKDAADKIPSSEKWINDSLKTADVFFLYPTTWYGDTWNASLDDCKLNRRTDRRPIKYQASVFNRSCRVYAPRYRQACRAAFEKGYEMEGKKSFDLAYEDVKQAFEYYLAHYNHGRPVIIASHSQGTLHARRLLREFFDSTALQKQLVAAYLIGFGVTDTMYHQLTPCSTSSQTGCYVTWASYQKGVEPGASPLYGNVCVNPISWSPDTIATELAMSKGGILLNFNKKYQPSCTTQVYKHFLWVDTKLPYVRKMKNLHIVDYNLYWYDIRENLAERIKAFYAAR